MDVVRLLRTSIIQTALIRATERECIPRGGGPLAGQLGRCFKTIDEIGPQEDRVLFQAGQYTALSSVGILVGKV